MNPELEIPFHKTKLAIWFLASFLLSVSGFFFLFAPQRLLAGFPVGPLFIRILGLVESGFFAYTGYQQLIKLLDRGPGLILSGQGITDHSSALSAGFIPWDEIVELRHLKALGQQFIMVGVRNPQSFIQKEKNPVRKRGMILNLKSYGSPIQLSAQNLRCSFPELLRQVEEQFLLAKRKPADPGRPAEPATSP